MEGKKLFHVTLDFFFEWKWKVKIMEMTMFKAKKAEQPY